MYRRLKKRICYTDFVTKKQRSIIFYPITIMKERFSRELRREKGFTLIEILIVVAIIAILASVVLIGLGPTQQSGRDARRLSDLHQIQNGLELFYNRCGFYPGNFTAPNCDPAATTGFAQMKGALTTADIGVNTVPSDPTNAGAHIYYYRTNGAAATQYVLAAQLENPNNTVFNSYTPPTITAFGSGDTLPASGCAKPDYCVTL